MRFLQMSVYENIQRKSSKRFSIRKALERKDFIERSSTSLSKNGGKFEKFMTKKNKISLTINIKPREIHISDLFAVSILKYKNSRLYI
mmetsp:Transcript_5668/g.7823  ORF Transcript_5668/g.7823 Transcript_5668/m.7823 type:complete len:88 (-) Transcript_5668:53-316(-)